MNDNARLYLEDMIAGRETPGGSLSSFLDPNFTPDRFGELVAPQGLRDIFAQLGEVPTLFAELGTFCGTTAASSTSNASLRTDQWVCVRPPIREMFIQSRVVGTQFRTEEAKSGVVQLHSTATGDDGTLYLDWTRQFISPSRDGMCRHHGDRLDTRVTVEPFDWASLPLPTDEEFRIAAPDLGNVDVGRYAESFVPGEPFVRRWFNLEAANVLEMTRGFGNLADVHYDTDRGLTVWGRLLHTLGCASRGTELQKSALIGIVNATHTAPVFLSAEVLRRRGQWREGAEEDRVSTELTPGEHIILPGRAIEIIPVQLDLTSHIPKDGYPIYVENGRQDLVDKAQANGGAVSIGSATLILATLKRAA